VEVEGAVEGVVEEVDNIKFVFLARYFICLDFERICFFFLLFKISENCY